MEPQICKIGEDVKIKNFTFSNHYLYISTWQVIGADNYDYYNIGPGTTVRDLTLTPGKIVTLVAELVA